jgi:NitT/TauT family transport system substrate-binding protein
MRAYLRAVRFYNDALADGRLAGPNGPEVISILTKYSALKDADLYRVITPPAIDPNGVVNVESLTKDWQFFKDTGQLDGKVGPADIVDTSFVAEAVAALGPYVAGSSAK